MSNGLLSDRNTYKNYLPDGDLRKKLDRIMSSTPTELQSLFEEIGFMRAAAEDLILMYEAANQLDDAGAKLSHKIRALEGVQRCFRSIESLSLTAAKVDQYNRTSSSIQMAKVIIDESITTAQRLFREFIPPEMMSKFARELRQSFEINDGAGEIGARRLSEANLLADAMDEATQQHVLTMPDGPFDPTVNSHSGNGRTPTFAPEVVKDGVNSEY
jgi:hypothetical protein